MLDEHLPRRRRDVRSTMTSRAGPLAPLGSIAEKRVELSVHATELGGVHAGHRLVVREAREELRVPRIGRDRTSTIEPPAGLGRDDEQSCRRR